MNGKYMLYIDQWGNHWTAHSVAELRRKIGGGRVSKMYCDSVTGQTYHTGYIVGPHWCTAYAPYRQVAR